MSFLVKLLLFLTISNPAFICIRVSSFMFHLHAGDAQTGLLGPSTACLFYGFDLKRLSWSYIPHR